jgi:hypothetical protein
VRQAVLAVVVGVMELVEPHLAQTQILVAMPEATVATPQAAAVARPQPVNHPHLHHQMAVLVERVNL